MTGRLRCTHRATRALVGLLLAALPAAATGQDASAWQRALDRVVPAVVALRVAATRPFGTETAGVSSATGFVVDAERGLILTNRHVVKPGPVTAEAVFHNHEKVELVPVYRDPVHDFGFFRFDPAALRFTRPHAIPLAPEAAHVGAEIRVVGNDAGEKLSILDGTLARLDRAAPSYGRGRYNDFNTFYIQAASSTSGGSSGAPVVDREGRAVALSAGAARRSSASFFLPLDRVVRALDELRAGRTPTRGTLQAVFGHASFEELRRLGLRAETEAAVREATPGATGLLRVAEVVPGGPADGVLAVGDVVLSVAGQPLRDFLTLEMQLDAGVGTRLPLEVQRGGEDLAVELRVGDLHALAPDRFLEFGGGVLHALSYQLARSFRVPVAGVVVAAPGYALTRAGIQRFARIETLAGRPVPDIETLEAELAALPDGARVPLRWAPLDAPHAERVSVLPVDRRWFPLRHCARDEASGRWPCREAQPAPPRPPAAPETVGLPSGSPRAVARVLPSLAFVEYDLPLRMDGAPGSSFSGAGLVLDAELGLVVVDRDTVPTALGDARLTFGRALSVPAEVVALHPEHGLALLRYDPRRIGTTPVRSAQLEPTLPERGEALWLVGLSRDQREVARRTELSGFEPTLLTLPTPPRFRESNLERLVPNELVPTVGGVLADSKGRVRALWASTSTTDERGRPRAFFAGIPADLLLEMRDAVRTTGGFRWHSLGAELRPLPLATARELGLSPADLTALEKHDPQRRQALEVVRMAADAPAAASLHPGDLLLAIDGRPVTTFREVERAARASEVTLRVLRDGAVHALRVTPLVLDGRGTERVVAFAGAWLQAPPRALAAQRLLPPGGVYVAGRWPGSPAQQYGLGSGLRVLAVDDHPTPDLTRFLAEVADRPDGSAVRLRVEDLERRPAVLTLELDLEPWPSWELRRGPGGWVGRRVTPAPELAGESSR